MLSIKRVFAYVSRYSRYVEEKQCKGIVRVGV